MIGERIEDIIQKVTIDTLNKSKEVAMPPDVIETDNLGEVIEKLSILHCRMWYLEDKIGTLISKDDSKYDSEIVDLKRKIDICFKTKRPKLVQAVNRMIQKEIDEGKGLIEESVKLYKGH